MTYTAKIQKAKAKLMLEHPYFGTIASALKLEPDSKQLTFKSDGTHIFINEEYIDKLSIPEVEFALANGAMHAVLKHQERKHSRDAWLWQEACDLAINAMLAKNGMQVPDYVNYQPKFEGMYAEEIYSILKEEMTYSEDINHESKGDSQAEKESPDESLRQKEKDNTPPSEPLDSKDNPDQKQSFQNDIEPIPEEIAALSEELKELFEQTLQKLNRQGTLPKDLEFVIPEYFSHQIDWREMLYRYIASHAKSTFSFMPPNMKYLYRGIYLPSLSSDLLRIVIAIDTSGSVDEKLLGIFLGEVQSITQQYPNYEIDIITADAKIQSHEVFLPGETLNYEIKGRGGTDFRPVFEYIDHHIDYPTLLLYFTDGLGTFPEEEPGYDLLWVMPEEREVPFGEIVLLEGV
ncbi:MAG: VWA-like domain-containing protein [Campylobacterota bacterium]|nr:VWA-like domain-containing protein [Campylobacterota bacterium]